MTNRLWVGLLCLGIGAGCIRQTRPDEKLPPKVTLEEAVELVPSHVPDREGWALDVLTALERHRLHPDLQAVCSVLAVIEQESGYKANPPVANLAKIVQGQLEDEAEKLGPVGEPLMDKLLGAKAKDSKLTFGERLRKVKTERDLDLVFRAMLQHYEDEYSVTYAVVDFAHGVSGRGGLAAINPITTAGSMQVSVRHAVELSEERDEDLEEPDVRDRLYTRFGGIYYGSARLLDFPAAYEDPVYRFADFNAGLYASRNAAIQEQVGELIGTKLALDGDLLIYDSNAEPVDRDSNSLKALLTFREKYARESLSEGELRRDVRKEKSQSFEETGTYRAVRSAYEKKTGKPAPYARLPDVTLQSPKLSKGRTTAWFAKNVKRRYEACLKRGE